MVVEGGKEGGAAVGVSEYIVYKYLTARLLLVTTLFFNNLSYKTTQNLKTIFIIAAHSFTANQSAARRGARRTLLLYNIIHLYICIFFKNERNEIKRKGKNKKKKNGGR